MSDTWRRAVKRTIDVVGAGAALLLLSPVIAASALAIRASMGSPVLFRQMRPGLSGKPFTLIKFRSMNEGPGTDDERLTRVGRLLRSTSIDELPSLVNVLRGDMSLVGPRPLLMEYLPLYSSAQARRHDTKPGITGLAQVSGRNDISWADRLAIDVEYVDRWTLALDLKILAQTLKLVVTRRGIAEPGHATKQPFTGMGLTSSGDL